VLYETYRTEKLSRTVHSDTQYEFPLFFFSNSDYLTDVVLISDSSILPEELASQSVRLKEEQLRREEEKVRCFVAA
jgi:cell division control protein 11